MSFGDSLRALVEDGSAPWGFLLAAAIVLALTARRRAGEKYEGLRVLR